MTRTMLGVHLDVEQKGESSIVRTAHRPLEVGDRIADAALFDGAGGRTYLHDLCDDSFVALYFTDVRRGPQIPPDIEHGLQSYIVSRWDAPLDLGLRPQSLLDVGSRVQQKFELADNTVVLLRPDDHVAAILPMDSADIPALYRRILGKSA